VRGRGREIVRKRERRHQRLSRERTRRDPKRGQRENDKGERGERFDWKGRQRGLFPFTSVFSVLRSILSVVPTRARVRVSHTHPHTWPNTHIYAFSFLSVLPLVSVDLLSYPPCRFSFCLSFWAAFVTIVRTCVYAYVCVCLVSIVREVSCRTALRSRGERAALYVGERENVF